MSQRPKLRMIEFAPPAVISSDEAEKPVTAMLAALHEKRERMLACLALACSVSLKRKASDLALYTMRIDGGYSSLYWFVARPGSPEDTGASDKDVNAHIAVNFAAKFNFTPHEAALQVQIAHDAINIGIVQRPEIPEGAAKEIVEDEQ